MPDDCHDLRSQQVDAAIAEYLEAVERGEAPDRAEFLERHADIAADLDEFLTNQRLLKQGQSSSGNNAPTVDLAGSTARPSAQAPTGRIIPAGLSSQLEIQTVLRKRLRLIAIIFGAALTIGLVVLPLKYGIRDYFWILLTGVAVLASIVWLCSQPLISLRSLRWIEAGLFAFLFLYCAWQDIVFVNTGWFSRLASYHFEGMIVAWRYLNATWTVFIILYGILIPNTARRCLVAVTILVLFRLAILAAVVLPITDVTADDKQSFLACSGFGMSFVAILAILGAHRIESLRRTAAEARQLGPYQLTRRLGAGGMGEVYLAKHALLRRPCALKLIRPDQVGNRSTLARFEREVQTMASLTHPNTVRVYDYGLAGDGTFYYSMEYLPGMSLHELVAGHGPLPSARAVYLLRQVCDALREAHGAGLVHRDIKPANILACQIGGMHDVAKLLDFGLVRDHGLDGNGAPLTRAGTIAGTPAYMSPEQVAGSLNVDARSDIYCLGAVAYFLVTGRPPFDGATAVEIMAAHLTQQAVPPRCVCSAVPEDFEKVIVCCLAKDPANRFSDTEALAAALARCGCANNNNWSAKQAASWWDAYGGSAERPS